MPSRHRIDEIDIQIIRKLQQDGRRAFADIASELQMAPSTIQQRANRLIESGLLKVRAVTDPIVLGVPITASVALEVDGARLSEVGQALAVFEEVGWVAICTGSYDILAEVACKDNEDLIDLIGEISRIEGVRSTETFMYLRIVKNTYQWGVP